MFKPKNALEILIVRAFLSYLDKGYGVLPLGNSIFAVAYEIYVRDFYEDIDCDVTCITVKDRHLYVDYRNDIAECYDGNYTPLWTPEECLYYTLLSVGLINEAQKYKSAVDKDREYDNPWKYYWKIDWNVKIKGSKDA